MVRVGPYRFEYALIFATMLISVLGFCDIYFGTGEGPQPHHHLHIATAFMWLFLLLVQLNLIAARNRELHRKAGLAVLGAAPLLVATTATLSVHSARKGVASGEGDFLIIQNVGVTIELAAFIVLGFLFKQRRKLHASLLLSTAILFMGIALFFALIAFAPMFRIEGPETFCRFQTAAMTGQGIVLAVGLLYFLRDRRNGWPFLAAAACFPLNEAIRALLSGSDLIDPLTEVVGSMNQPLTFAAVFALMLATLAATVLPKAGRPQTA